MCVQTLSCPSPAPAGERWNELWLPPLARLWRPRSWGAGPPAPGAALPPAHGRRALTGRGRSGIAGKEPRRDRVFRADSGTRSLPAPPERDANLPGATARAGREQAPRRAGRSCCTKANEWERAGRAPPPAPRRPRPAARAAPRGSPPGAGMRGAAAAPGAPRGPRGAQPAGRRRSDRRAAAAPQRPARFFQELLSHDNLLQFLVFPRRFPPRRVTRGGTGV